MSIPKEPRQLMINLMYLVLTAMLALNVSAEIINAFFHLDKGNLKSNSVITDASKKVFEGMTETAKSKSQYQPMVEAAKQVQSATSDLTAHIQSVRTRLITEAGGPYTAETAKDHPELIGYPVNKKDKDIPQRLFVTGDYGSEGKKTPEGDVIQKKIESTIKKYEEIVESLFAKKIDGTVFYDSKNKEKVMADIKSKMTLAIGQALKDPSSGNKEKSWAESTFGHMPVAAVLPILSQIENNAKTSEAAIVNYLSENMGKLVIEYDKFAVFSSAPKSYILQGDKYEAEIALGAYSSQASFSVKVDGQNLPVKDGIAKYTASGSSVGEKKYNATIVLNNPLTGKSEVVNKTFSYEVGAPSAAINLEKMNVLYVGVDNPLSVSVSGVSSNQVQVSGPGLNLSGGGGKYVAKPSSPSPKATITITGAGKSFPFEYRVKPIPDPVAKLGGNELGGKIGSGEFKAKASSGVFPILDGFDFDAKCNMLGYTLTYVPKRQDPVSQANAGSKPTGTAAELVNRAKPGDQYFFNDVKVRCPGWAAGKEVNSLAFTIK